MPVNGSKAPVCPISRNQAVSGMPMRKMPPIPRANDLVSAIAVLNQLALLVNPGVNSGQSTGSSSGESFSYGPGYNPNLDNGAGGGAKRKKRWEETDRGLEQVEVKNPANEDITIKFPRIYRLEFEEHRTFTNLDWELGADSMS